MIFGEQPNTGSCHAHQETGNRCHILNIAIVSDTSFRPQHDVGNLLVYEPAQAPG